MAATNYVTKIYNVTRGGESQDYTESVQSASAQTSTSAIAVIGPVWYSVYGTIGGATIKVQSLDPNSTWNDIANTTASEAVDKRIDFPPNAPNTIKCIIAYASSNTDLYVRFQAGSGRDIYD